MDSAWVKFRRLGWHQRWLLLEAALTLTAARLALLLPFRWLAGTLGRRGGETPPELPQAQLDEARLVGWAVRAAAKRTPWKSACLAQALTARWMLKRRAIPATFYLGVNRKNQNIAAHAWLRSGPAILTGAEGRQDYTVLSTFGDD
ncbi:MAG TPA: lasso peptide biosynthesis B2 protein [Anaerolineaceae bacterium]|nr:lasso peptide biosynthesis B2 protein [Anaerolineaceae bacterium]HPN50369.1 lasso peptide biosynthesis B2 protein [Anaerolineaceae bacterium]